MTNLSPKEKTNLTKRLEDQYFKLTKFIEHDFQGTYGVPWTIDLDAECHDAKAFERTLNSFWRCMVRKYGVKAFYFSEDRSDGGFRTHGIIRFSKESLTLFKRIADGLNRNKGGSPAWKANQVMKDEVVREWRAVCARHGVECSQTLSPETCLHVPKYSTKDKVTSYMLKLVKDRWYDLRWRTVNLYKKRFDDSDVGLYSDRSDLPSRRAGVGLLVEELQKRSESNIGEG